MGKLRTSMRGFLVLAAGLVAGYAAGRWTGSTGREGTQDASPAVATFQGGSVTADELRAALEEQGPLLRQDSASPAGRKRLAQELVRQKLMEQDAAAKGYDRAPEFLRERRRALVALYLRKELEEPLARHAPTDAELQDYLDRHRAEYAQSERVRIAHIFLAAPAGDGAARKNKLVEAEVLADRVIESRSGLHLIKLRTRVEATNADLASLSGLLRGKVAAELRSKQEQEFFAALEKKAGVQFDEAAMAGVQIGPATGKAVSSASGR